MSDTVTSTVSCELTCTSVIGSVWVTVRVTVVVPSGNVAVGVGLAGSSKTMPGAVPQEVDIGIEGGRSAVHRRAEAVEGGPRRAVRCAFEDEIVACVRDDHLCSRRRGRQEHRGDPQPCPKQNTTSMEFQHP